MTALMTAAGAPIAPASPQPLTPSGLWVQSVPCVATVKFGRIVGARHAVVHERAGEKLAALAVVAAFLEERLADPLRQPAMDLALDDHRIDDAAEIVDGGEIDDAHRAGVAVDLDLADMGARTGR